MYTVRYGDTLYQIANQFGTSVSAIVEANALYPPITDPNLIMPGQKLLVRLPGMSQASAVMHQVTEGDTLYELAARYSTGVEMLAAFNQMEQPDILRVAQLLYVPAFVYEVEQGDSLYRISRRFGMSMHTLLNANQGRPGLSPDVIYPGWQMVVPLPSSANIVVFQPLPGSPIADGQRLTGYARAFEANVLYQIQDANDQVVTSEQFFTASAGAPAFGRFETALTLQRSPTASTGVLMVYTRSARDNSVQDLVEVPVRFV